MKNWKQIQDEVIENCTKAGITNMDFVKILLIVERRVLTMKNKLNKKYRSASWDSVINSKTYIQAFEALDKLNGTTYGNIIYKEIYKKYCQVAGIAFDANIGDWLA